MSAAVTVLAPVLRRPQRVQPLILSLAASAEVTPLALLFLVSPEDKPELREIQARMADAPSALEVAVEVVPWKPGPGDYAKKINHGARLTSSRYLFLGADDLSFPLGWAERAIAVQLQTRVCVVGTSDGGNARTMDGTHSTHSLVDRDYIECGTIDEPGAILHEGYDHQFVDTELVATAQMRGTYRHAEGVVVEHLHPDWGKSQRDDTYLKGQRAFAADRMLFEQRRPLWETP